ncbi:hypothetical protein RND71_012047 [Anisodus tanguticus]|uniref:Isopenicillin N synthase-like Fe(2+) 2OG dioxygenase domain-containing protein n=1 Tax=Anisodus tanguticus TaxID=243964 RepID=A0AAE1SEF5_9SOLA|nr:hypothetical protein RND71_012047 [Anisodus tanguticus]
MAEMKEVVRTLLDLPTEIKRRNKDVIAGSGYMAPSEKNPLYEALGLFDMSSSKDVDEFCTQLGASPHQRETIKKYAAAINGLMMDIVPMGFRYTDSGFLTILQDDENVGGLEVMKKSGEFVAVDPRPNTLLVTLGDIGRVWSNGRFYTVKHRVICKEAKIRVSIASFLLGPRDTAVEPPPELVDTEHPRVYVPFTFNDYRKLRLSTKLQAGEALDLMRTNL